MSTILPNWTYYDLIDRLADYAGGNSNGRTLKNLKRAALDAYRTVINEHRWSCLWTRGRIDTNAPYSTGTIEYDHSGHASGERIMTLSGGTWPSWVDKGVIYLSGDTPYIVDKRLDGSEIQLSAVANPGSDESSGTSYTLLRHTYTLPKDFSLVGPIADLDQQWGLGYIPPSAWLPLYRAGNDQSDPRLYTITDDPDSYGRLAIRFFPPPDASYPIDFMYRRSPLPLRIFEYTTGTASSTADSTTITGSGTNWTSKLEGCVIRLSADSSELPTGIDGLNPFEEEAVIESVDGTGALTVDSAIPQTLSGVKYRISSRLDIHQATLLTPILRNMEMQFEMIQNGSHVKEKGAAYQFALKRAKEYDARNIHRQPDREPRTLAAMDYDVNDKRGT